MHVIVVGCGGWDPCSQSRLVGEGHSVAVIDKDEIAFRRLRPNWGGTEIVGFGFDRDTLIEAGAERADALAAVTSGDNSNILTARIARENFMIPAVDGADLRSAPRRDLPATRDIDRCHGPLDDRPGPAGARRRSGS